MSPYTTPTAATTKPVEDEWTPLSFTVAVWEITLASACCTRAQTRFQLACCASQRMLPIVSGCRERCRKKSVKMIAR